MTYTKGLLHNKLLLFRGKDFIRGLFQLRKGIPPIPTTSKLPVSPKKVGVRNIVNRSQSFQEVEQDAASSGGSTDHVRKSYIMSTGHSPKTQTY